MSTGATFSLSGEDYGVIPVVLNTSAIVAQSLQFIHATIAAVGVPWCSIIAAPFALYDMLGDLFVQVKLVAVASKVDDAAFWTLRSVNTVGRTLSNIIKPLSGSMALTGLQLSQTAHFALNVFIPQVVLVTNVIGLVANSWALGRAIRDYRTMQQSITAANVREFVNAFRSNSEKGRFRESFLPFPQNFRQMNDVNCLKALKMGARFSICDRSSIILSSALSITAAVLLLLSAHYQVVAGALIISSAGIGFIPVIIKNILIRKSAGMLNSPHA